MVTKKFVNEGIPTKEYLEKLPVNSILNIYGISSGIVILSKSGQKLISEIKVGKDLWDTVSSTLTLETRSGKNLKTSDVIYNMQQMNKLVNGFVVEIETQNTLNARKTTMVKKSAVRRTVKKPVVRKAKRV